MVWRSVVVSKPAKLRREHFSLVIEQDATARVPFEDIAVIVLDHREITVTHPVLAACGDYGIGLFSTGDKHQPNGVFTSFLSHSRATRMLRLQLQAGKPCVKQAWADIVRAKISNQAACLRLTKRSGVERIESYARRVRSGDSEGMEALAAAYYFPQLFGRGFDRKQERWINSALDYGYAVLRGSIARALVAHGFFPSIGIFHSSEQNAFNLADDLIEPFRPLVDIYVAKQVAGLHDGTRELVTSEKAGLVALLNTDIGMPRGRMTTLAAIDQVVHALGRLFEGNSESRMELPRLIGLGQHSYES